MERKTWLSKTQRPTFWSITLAKHGTNWPARVAQTYCNSESYRNRFVQRAKPL
jgi:hypothetical protein